MHYIRKTGFILILCISLLSCKKEKTNELIVFDINGNFPVKTLDVEDVAEIEYLTLELNDDYLFSYFVGMTDSFIICEGNGKVFFFNRENGKPVSMVNRRGNGPEEYVNIILPRYSETSQELYVLDHPLGIKVYSRDGTYKRELPFRSDLYPNWGDIHFDYDKDQLLYNVISFRGGMKDTSFVFISKQDGLMEGLYIPYEKKVDLISMEGIGLAMPENACHAVRNGKDYLLTEYSIDTVYRFTPEHELIPVLVRTPSIQQMEYKTILHSWLETSKYLFFSTEALEYDRKTLKGFPKKGYLMEKDSREFFQASVGMRDYKGKELLIDPFVIGKSSNERAGIITLNAAELLAANEDNKLSGKLKEVTDRLTPDDEMVFMILKFK